MRFGTALILAFLLTSPATMAIADCGAACDADKDGVVDAIDQCTESEPGAPVTMRGCAHDTDSDGVPDYRDNCPHRPAHSVDAWGCPIGREIPLLGVNFEVNSARLLESSHAALDNAASILRDYVDLEAEVAGHTDNQGSAEHNRRLSRQRAEAVRLYLVGAGIEPERIIARGYGESRPVASNESEESRSKNRRVVLQILGGQVDTQTD